MNRDVIDQAVQRIVRRAERQVYADSTEPNNDRVKKLIREGLDQLTERLAEEGIGVQFANPELVQK